jgi:alpha-ketoglutarate-dependent taurine dioxygenase
VKVLPFGRTSARLVEREGGETLADLPADRIRELFAPAGMLLFRGFAGGADPFKAFASKFTARYLRDLGGSKTLDAAGDYLQSLVPAGNPQDLHCESARGPNPPDLLWFHCVTPARSGGETTFADGVEIWNGLTESTRRLFSAKPVRFTETLPAAQWRVGLKYFFLAELDVLTLGGTTFRFNHDDTLCMEFVTPAVRRTKWTGQQAFTNSITGPYPGGVFFEDGTPVAAETIAEIKAVHARVQDEIRWQPGDIAMLDNTRYMHGRRAFNDPARQHLTLMGMANF